MAYFPMFINLEGQEILIVGGGNTALRKAEKLSYFKPHIRFISLDFQAETLALIKKYRYEYKQKAFDESDLENAFMVIAATNNREVNAVIAKSCEKQHIPVNSVDDLENCSFLFPSLYTNRKIVCGISSGGSSPIIAQHVRSILENNVESDLGDINERLGALRLRIKTKGTMSQRKALYHQLLDLLLEDPKMSDEKLMDYCERYWQDEN